jgi:2-methylcitrate dehydratase PrpD
VRAHVHQAAIDVLGPVTDPRTVHQAKFSMGFVLALIAFYGHAGITDFTDEALQDRKIREFLSRVEMVMDPEIDAAYPERWIGLVEVETIDGQHFTSRVDVPKGDPGNTLSREEIADKTRRLAAYQQGASSEEIDQIMARVWTLDQQPNVRDLLPRG